MKILWDLTKLCEKKPKPCGQNGTDHPGVSPPYVTGAIIHCFYISPPEIQFIQLTLSYAYKALPIL